jgi:anti-sigma regulatory factor (Ser/Thr protein kinase)
MMVHYTDAYDTPEIAVDGDACKVASKMPESDHTSSSVSAGHAKARTALLAGLNHTPVPVLPSACPGQEALRMHPQSWPLKSYLELGALPGAVPCARLHARQVAWEWGLRGLAETIELLVSELTTNAVQAVADLLPCPAFIRFWLVSDRVRVLIEVWDVNPRPPMAKAFTGDGVPAFDEEGGRGLFLVAALSHRWGWYPVREWGGKVVWCELIALAIPRTRTPAIPEWKSGSASLSEPASSICPLGRSQPWSQHHRRAAASSALRCAGTVRKSDTDSMTPPACSNATGARSAG